MATQTVIPTNIINKASDLRRSIAAGIINQNDILNFLVKVEGLGSPSRRENKKQMNSAHARSYFKSALVSGIWRKPEHLRKTK